MAEAWNTFLTRDVVELVADMLSRRFRKGEIKNALAELNGGERLSPATCETALRRARALLLRRVRQGPEEQRAEALGFYEQVIRDDKTTPRDKMAAQDGINRILGLDFKFNPPGEDPEDAAVLIREALKSMDESVGSNGDRITE